MKPYQDRRLPVEERIDDLLGRMSPEEKIGQMNQLGMRGRWLEDIKERHVGAAANLFDPDLMAQIQDHCLRRTRLNIPLLFEHDAIHGHALFPGTTVFPTPLALSCSFDPRLVQAVAGAAAKEIYVTGVRSIYSPVLCLPRDMRWGRVDETFGEDPYLIGELGAAMFRGYRGAGRGGEYRVAACMKHFAGYGEARGGRDGAESDHGKRKMLSLFLPPFEKLAKMGCDEVMIAYHVIDGVPCVANRWLLTDLLKEKWGFKGVARTDYNNADALVHHRYLAKNLKEAYTRSINAGVDLFSCSPGLLDVGPDLVRAGRVSMERIDDAVRRVLRVKFRAGLFDDAKNCYPDRRGMRRLLNCPAHRKVALKAARESLVLLKNSGILPLDRSKISKVAVVGGNADDKSAFLGCWSAPRGKDIHPRENIVTLVDGLKRLLGDKRVTYAFGCDAQPEYNLSKMGSIDPSVPKNQFDRKPTDLRGAIEAGRSADVIVAGVGDHVTLSSEGTERADLSLSHDQSLLLRAMKALGKPLIVVLLNSKPLTIPWVIDLADAVIEAWNPGSEGGTAIAEVLFGDVNPSGKLTVSWPRCIGQQPVYYNQTPGWHGLSTYVEVGKDPLFHFGYGLSYTTFGYRNLRTSKKRYAPDDTIEVSVEVRNTGKRTGTEIVQLYVDDLVSSVSTPIKELKAFARVMLRPGQRKTVRFSLAVANLWLIDESFRKVVEAGEFAIMVGASSSDKDLLVSTVKVTETKVLETYE